MAFYFKKRTPASLPTPATGKAVLFIDSADGYWKSKDEAGTVTTLTGALDSSVVHLAGAESVTGLKTFSLGVKLTPIAGNSYSANVLYADSDNDCPTYFCSDSNVSLQIGQEEWIRVINKTGSSIANGSAVYLTGWDTGTVSTGVFTIAPSKADAGATAMVAGVTTETIANNGVGWVTARGVIHGLNTNSFTSGDTLYLSAATAGLITNAAPAQPNFVTAIGRVGAVSATVGTIYVRPYSPTSITAPLLATISAGGALALSLPAAAAGTPGTDGYLKGLDKYKLDNMYVDVTCWSSTAGNNLVGDDSTDNTSRWATLFAALPVGATVYFPPGTFRGNFIINSDKHLRIKGAGKYTTTIKAITALGDPSAFHITAVAWYNQFEDMAFTATTTSSTTTGIYIDPGAANSAVGTNIYRCSFTGLGKAVNAQGAQAANLSVWDSLDISVPTTNGCRGLVINGSTINLVISNSTINGTQATAATNACIEVNQSGSIQLLGGDFIGGLNTLLLNANQGGSTSIAAVFATNCFFDQSGGSTVKITGANVVNRVKFVQCGITGGAVAGACAIEIASTGTGAAGGPTAAADGIDLFDCDIYPNGGSGTLNGVLITGAQGVQIANCRISGWTNGIQASPAAAAGYTKIVILNNKMGATNNFTTFNTVGLLLNAGSFAYGSVIIQGNDFSGSTTAITDNSGIGTGTAALGIKSITENVGGQMPVAVPANYTATAIPLTTVTNVDSRGGLLIPAGVRPCSIRVMVYATNAATAQTLTATLRYGTNNSNADAAVQTQAFTVGTAALGSGTFIFNVDIASATLLYSALEFKNGNNAATGIAGNISLFSGLNTAATISTAANNWLGVYFSSATAAAITIRAVKLEIVSQ